MEVKGTMLITRILMVAVVTIVVAVIVVFFCIQANHGDGLTVYSRFIPVEGFKKGAEASYLVFDKDTDLVYVIVCDYKMLAISPYYIVDESNTQRIAEYPRDLDYLIHEKEND